MGLPSKPTRAIFPIFAIFETQYTFLGTGFFISDSGTFLTAKHILMGVKGQLCAAMINPDYTISEYKIIDLTHSKKFDMSLGTVDGTSAIQSLTIAKENPPINQDIITLEYSRIYPRQTQDGIVHLIIMPSFRKGHIVCFYISDYPESTPTNSLELSFPALKGASGAPVVVEHSGVVAGMIVENIQHELLPSHIERITEGDNFTEETKFVLPAAKAISWKHLNDFVKSPS